MADTGAKPPGGLTERLERATAALTGGPLRPDERIGVAVSGGADSMALLDLAVTVWPGRVAAATVDHGLRAGSAQEAEMVAGWCVRQHVPHDVLRPDRPITGSLQMEARTVRYRLLDAWAAGQGIGWKMTAHHADDQLETMVMRMNRAAGLAGMAGIRARRGQWLRPLLSVRKSELVAHAAARGLPVADDPSNADPRFDRARLRARLADTDWLDPYSAARTAAALAEADQALAWMADQFAALHVSRDGAALRLECTDAPRELLRRLLLSLMEQCVPGGPVPRGEQIDEAIVQLSHGRKISLGAVIVTGGAQWTLVPAPPRKGA